MSRNRRNRVRRTRTAWIRNVKEVQHGWRKVLDMAKTKPARTTRRSTTSTEELVIDFGGSRGLKDFQVVIDTGVVTISSTGKKFKVNSPQLKVKDGDDFVATVVKFKDADPPDTVKSVKISIGPPKAVSTAKSKDGK